jgi:hypothetical protein
MFISLSFYHCPRDADFHYLIQPLSSLKSQENGKFELFAQTPHESGDRTSFHKLALSLEQADNHGNFEFLGRREDGF